MPTTERSPAPSLEFVGPTCPMCDEETSSDDTGYNCERCGAWWNDDGSFGGWDDPDAEQCESRWINPFDGVVYRCALAVDHPAAMHTDGHVVGWRDREAL